MKNCKECGNSFETKKGFESRQVFCSSACDSKWRYKSPKHKPVICTNCNIEFIPKAADRTKYCSRECAFEHKRAKPKNKAKPACVVCGKELDGRAGTKYCSGECISKNNYRLYLQWKNSDKYKDSLKKQREKHVEKARHYDLICHCCERSFKANRSTCKYCSPECSKKAYYASEPKKEERRRYRARKVNAYVAPVFTEEIIKRDKGICGICGKKISLKLQYPHPMSLSIDHILPLSDGGTHEPKNVQLAHFICNSVKGMGGTDQLRLFG